MQKRLFDLFCSVILLVILWPLFLFTALRIKVDSPGPVFFKQKRLGYHSIPFIIFKFRSMKVEAEGCLDPVRSRDDLRITKFGRWLRSTHLDELPQLFNVLRGDMSLVGPRAFPVNDLLSRARQVSNYRNRFQLLPGITGLPQIRGRVKNSQKGVSSGHLLDLYYLRHRNACLDCKILLRTIRAMIRRQGV